MKILEFFKPTSKAWGGAVAAGIAEATGVADAIAELLLWGLLKAGVTDIPQAPVKVLVLAAVTWGVVYFFPKNRPAPEAEERQAA